VFSVEYYFYSTLLKKLATFLLKKEVNILSKISVIVRSAIDKYFI